MVKLERGEEMDLARKFFRKYDKAWENPKKEAKNMDIHNINWKRVRSSGLTPREVSRKIMTGPPAWFYQ